MTDVHLRKHEAVQDCGSYEVWFDDGRPSKFFYFDDLPKAAASYHDECPGPRRSRSVRSRRTEQGAGRIENLFVNQNSAMGKGWTLSVSGLLRGVRIMVAGQLHLSTLKTPLSPAKESVQACVPPVMSGLT
jgi:hypothetical protein